MTRVGFTMAEWYDSHRPVFSETEARGLALGGGVDAPGRDPATNAPSHLVFELSLAMLACLSPETAAKVEQYRAWKMRPTPEDEIAWRELVSRTRAWREAGYPRDQMPQGGQSVV